MGEYVTVDDKSAFVDHIVEDDDNDLDADAAEELWDIWSFRIDNGADDCCIIVPAWFANNEWGMRRPALFGEVEYDNDSKGAILFDRLRFVDIGVLENGIWDQVTVTEALSQLDVSGPDSPVDEAGMDWIPRSLLTIYERGDDDDDGDSDATSTDSVLDDDQQSVLDIAD